MDINTQQIKTDVLVIGGGTAGTMAVITNGFVSAQLRKMQAAGIEHFFEVVVVSQAIGFAKPSPEIFHHALSRLKNCFSDKYAVRSLSPVGWVERSVTQHMISGKQKMLTL
ncbi:HAD-IA family hydrolase [Nostoc sp.]|uniref:HAD-IA family hydrolase n=1 Tax=Nostoc sp. TaxID=1180 RepID=UPI002FFC1533